MRYRHRHVFMIMFVVIVILGACGKIGKHASVAPFPSSGTPAVGQTWSASNPWSVPNPKLSPGSTQGGGSYSQVCPHVDPALESARPDYADKARVYAAYGMSYPSVEGQFEMDHVIPIELGGAPDSAANLYPERNTPPDPAMMSKWGLDSAYVHNPKDILEDALHTLVCSGKVSLATAQQAISTDWVAAYHTYVEGMNP